MHETLASDAGRHTAIMTLLAWVIAHDERISLEDTSSLPKALMNALPRGALPDEMEDQFRVSARDFTMQVLRLAASMRRGGI
ncbi:hypothetical protein [Piscinibacter defluvii]|uniref:hypothetical protein n=1 Tax=Piscinibacter defluvii TaxID=1796922 RepID=UPI000FDE845C|nr:hypothetical protein [Piscinibacter defluvii]